MINAVFYHLLQAERRIQWDERFNIAEISNCLQRLSRHQNMVNYLGRSIGNGKTEREIKLINWRYSTYHTIFMWHFNLSLFRITSLKGYVNWIQQAEGLVLTLRCFPVWGFTTFTREISRVIYVHYIDVNLVCCCSTLNSWNESGGPLISKKYI